MNSATVNVVDRWRASECFPNGSSLGIRTPTVSKLVRKSEMVESAARSENDSLMEGVKGQNGQAG